MLQFTSRFLFVAIAIVGVCFTLVHYFGFFGGLVVGVFYAWLLMPVWLTFLTIFLESRGRPK